MHYLRRSQALGGEKFPEGLCFHECTLGEGRSHHVCEACAVLDICVTP